MPENASTKGAFLNAAAGNRNSGGNRSSYQDKDKPAQIRFSNISAGKDEHLMKLLKEEAELLTRTLS